MKNRLRKIKGMTGAGIVWCSYEDGFRSPLTAAVENPDVLSDESVMYPPRDYDEEEARAAYLRKFALAIETLTAKQMAVIMALQRYDNQQEAADSIGITRSTLSVTLLQIQRKIEKTISKTGNRQ